MSAEGTNPTVRQREPGMRLRELRDGLGLTVKVAAERLLCSATKISRLETGTPRASLRDVRDLCGIYGETEQADADEPDEAVQRQQVGGPAVMQEQLDEILKSAADEKATVEVIPFDVGAHASTDSNFDFLEFGGNSSQRTVVLSRACSAIATGRASH